MASLHFYHDAGCHELIRHYDGESDYVSVHQLVMLREGHDPHKIFAGVDKWHIHHKNKVAWDNRPENLELLTPKEHAKRHGLDKFPEIDYVDWEGRFKYIRDKSLITKDKWKAIKEAHNLIIQMAEEFDVGDEIIKDAMDIFLRAREKDTLNGSKMSDVAKAAFLLATHDSEDPIPKKIFEKHYEHSKLMVKYRMLSSRLDLGILPPSPIDALDFTAKHFQFDDKTKIEIKKILESYDTNGRGTSVMLASALYASQFIRTDVVDNLTQNDVANMFNISKMAVRNHYRRMIDEAQQPTYKSFANAKL